MSFSKNSEENDDNTLPTDATPTEILTTTSTITDNLVKKYKLIDDRGAIIVGPEKLDMCIWRRGSIGNSLYSVQVRPCESHNKAKWRYYPQTGKIEGRNCFLTFQQISGIFLKTDKIWGPKTPAKDQAVNNLP